MKRVRKVDVESLEEAVGLGGPRATIRECVQAAREWKAPSVALSPCQALGEGTRNQPAEVGPDHISEAR